jgi:orotidine-5'-phosphate decarboxylase
MSQLVDKDNFGRAIVGLCYTSNPSAREVQDVLLADGRVYWEFIAERTLAWAEELGVVEDAGLVMAAAYELQKGSGEIFSQHLTRGREIVGDKMWYLIPGVGTQEGFIKETVKASYNGAGSIAINSSSGITTKSLGPDFAEASSNESQRLAQQMFDALR